MCTCSPEGQLYPGLHQKKCGQLKEGRFKLDIRKKLDIRNKFFTMRVARHWNGLPRGAVDAPFLEVFKARLDGALSNLV